MPKYVWVCVPLEGAPPNWGWGAPSAGPPTRAGKPPVERRASDVRHAADLAAESPLRVRRATHIRRAADAPDRAGCVDSAAHRYGSFSEPPKIISARYV
jgi:hypothetical protein